MNRLAIRVEQNRWRVSADELVEKNRSREAQTSIQLEMAKRLYTRKVRILQ